MSPDRRGAAIRANLALLFLLTLPALAQPLTILCGSPTDQYFSGGAAWTMPASNAAPLQFLRYAPSFSYDIPLTSGMYSIGVVMAEPNAAAAGKRVMTVTAQGQRSAPIDLFALTGADNVAYTLPMMALVGAGILHLQFAATVGNAVGSEIVLTPWTGITGGQPLTSLLPGTLAIGPLTDGTYLAVVVVNTTNFVTAPSAAILPLPNGVLVPYPIWAVASSSIATPAGLIGPPPVGPGNVFFTGIWVTCLP